MVLDLVFVMVASHAVPHHVRFKCEIIGREQVDEVFVGALIDDAIGIDRRRAHPTLVFQSDRPSFLLIQCLFKGERSKVRPRLNSPIHPEKYITLSVQK